MSKKVPSGHRPERWPLFDKIVVLPPKLKQLAYKYDIRMRILAPMSSSIKEHILIVRFDYLHIIERTIFMEVAFYDG